MEDGRCMVKEVEGVPSLGGSKMLSCMRTVTLLFVVVVLLVVVVGVAYLEVRFLSVVEVEYLGVTLCLVDLWAGWAFCGGGNGSGSGDFQTGVVAWFETGLVVFEWKRRFFVTCESDFNGGEYFQCCCTSLWDGEVSGFCVFLERDCLGNMVGANVLIEVMVEVVVGKTTEVVKLN